MKNKAELPNLFLLAAILFAMHFVEQWFTDFWQVTTDVKAVYSKFQSLFDHPDRALLLVVGISSTTWWLAMYLLLRGGRGVPLVALFAGFLLLLEVHHLLRSLVFLRYTAGTITGFLLFILGTILIGYTIE